MEKFLIPPSKETLSENPKDQTSMGRTSLQVLDPIVCLKDNQILDILVKPKQNSSKIINNKKADKTLKKRTIDKTQARKQKIDPLKH